MPESNLDMSASALPENKGLALRGLWEVFYKPTALFSALVERPKILLPYIIYILAMGICVYVTIPMLAEEVFQNPEVRAKTAEQIANQPGVTMENVVGIWAGVMMGGSALVYILLPLAVAGLALFWGNFVFGTRAKFVALLSITLYAGVLYWIGECVLLPMAIAKQSALVSISPAVLFVDQAFTGVWYSVLSKFSLFHVWEIVVLSIGFGIALRVSKGKAVVVALGSMGLMTLLGLMMLMFRQ